jgi:hypothetical protein
MEGEGGEGVPIMAENSLDNNERGVAQRAALAETSCEEKEEEEEWGNKTGLGEWLVGWAGGCCWG